MLVMVDEVEPRHDVQEQARVSRVSRRHSLDVGVHLGVAVEGLAGLDFRDHFAHVHGHFAGVFGEAVEAYCISKEIELAEALP
jgi:hypothetical protein